MKSKGFQMETTLLKVKFKKIALNTKDIIDKYCFVQFFVICRFWLTKNLKSGGLSEVELKSFDSLVQFNFHPSMQSHFEIMFVNRSYNYFLNKIIKNGVANPNVLYDLVL